jgi:hypothetical protein
VEVDVGIELVAAEVEFCVVFDVGVIVKFGVEVK